jgi:hypothetical protein
MLGAELGNQNEWDMIDQTINREGLTTSFIETAISEASPSTTYNTYNTGYYTGDVITSAALLTIAEFEAAQPGKPWFLELSYPVPNHAVVTQPPGGSCSGGDDCLDETLAYWDDELQAIVDAVELSNTVFFIVNDNGPLAARAPDVRGCKSTIHECGISLPFIAFGGGIAAASDIAGLHSIADLAVTIPQLMGARVPDVMDGCSLLPELFPDGGWSGCSHTYLYSISSNGADETLRREDGYKLDVLSGSEEMYKVSNTGFGEDEGSNLCTGSCPGGLSGDDLAAYTDLKAEHDSL